MFKVFEYNSKFYLLLYLQNDLNRQNDLNKQSNTGIVEYINKYVSITIEEYEDILYTFHAVYCYWTDRSNFVTKQEAQQAADYLNNTYITIIKLME